MKTSDDGLQFITKWEAVRLCVYKDILGIDTVGIGHRVLAGENFDGGITMERALQILANDIRPCEEAIARAITVPLSQHQFDALGSWLFNCGPGAITNSQVQAAANALQYDRVPSCLELWCKGSVDGKLVVIDGLLNRRRAEGQMWRAPDLPTMLPTEQDRIDLSKVVQVFEATWDDYVREIAAEASEEAHEEIGREHEEAFDKQLDEEIAKRGKK